MNKPNHPPILRQNASYMVFMLALVGLFNSTDRVIFSVALQSIKQEFHFSDSQLGLIGGFAFGVFYALAALPIGWLAAKWPRRSVIALCLALWSLFTALTAAATGFLSLFIARMVVGIGEAGGTPLSIALISARFPPTKRAGATSLFLVGVNIGSILGLWATGALISHIGWRGAFLILGLPGMILALLFRFTIAEPQEPGREIPPQWRDVIALRHRRALVQVTMQFIGSALLVYGITAWSASFYQREFGMTPSQTGFALGIVTGGANLAGSLLGGFINDRGTRRTPDAGLRALLWMMVASLPISMAAFATHNLYLSLALLLITSLIAGARLTILYTAQQNLTEAHLRPLGTAFVASITVLIGSGLGPVLIGTLSDFAHLAYGEHSLRVALITFNLLTLWPIYHAHRTLRVFLADYSKLHHPVTE